MAKQLKTITAGRLVTACLYTVPRYRRTDSPYLRREKARAASEGRSRINRRTSAQKFEGLVFSNFGAGDYYCTFEYDPAHLPSVRREVLRDWRRFRARLRDGGWPDLRYIYVPEHRHGAGRWHIHAILGGTGGMLELAAWQIEQAWGCGPVTVRPILRSFSEVAELSRYLTKERPEVGDRGWIPSLGLARPSVESCRVPDSRSLVLPPGCYSIDRREVKNEYGEYIFLKYYRTEGDGPHPKDFLKL